MDSARKPNTFKAFVSPLFISLCQCLHSRQKRVNRHALFSTCRSSTVACNRITNPPLQAPVMFRRRRISWTSQTERGEENEEKNERNDDDARAENANSDAKNSDDSSPSDLGLPDLRELFSSAGKPGCKQCEGKGEILCPVCNGTGFFTLTMMETTSATTCRMCRGRRNIPCPTCRAIVFKSILWWDRIPSDEDDPDEDWRKGPDGPRIRWGDPPNEP